MLLEHSAFGANARGTWVRRGWGGKREHGYKAHPLSHWSSPEQKGIWHFPPHWKGQPRLCFMLWEEAVAHLALQCGTIDPLPSGLSFQGSILLVLTSWSAEQD